MIPRTLFSAEHEDFRQSVRRFIEAEVVPHHDRWEEEGIVPREIWRRAGEMGMLCATVPERYGGQGGDFLFSLVVGEEMARAGANGPYFHLHSDVVTPYVVAYGSEEQKRSWLPRMVSGEAIGAIAMTEPGGGSDLQGIETTASADADGYVISGQKVFISNGQLADVIIIAAKTDRTAGARGVTLFLVDTTTAGFERGRRLKKVGLKAQDTSELFFSEMRVPASAVLGEVGAGFRQLMTELAQERLVQACRSVTSAEAAIEWTVAYTRDRQAFGGPISDFQNTRFKVAELVAETTAQRAFVDRCVALHLEGELEAADAAIAKLNATNLHCRVVDECLQLHGGWGYMWEYPIARAYVDARQARLAGGTTEVMKLIIARQIYGTES
ncbi:MAG TPA: acyl-CoA dehydrogenase family protein [Solirubrobacterales bacterium]|nr:acyl-CoA dehydrogenase family protein [Solirubrobacterales bacterium]